MKMLRFLLTRYARPFYWRLATVLLLLGGVTLGASFTPYFETAVAIYLCLLGLVLGSGLTFGILVANALAAGALGRSFDRFEAAYNAYRKANGIEDIFYLEADLAEAAARESAKGAR